jgi:hypothetical protein
MANFSADANIACAQPQSQLPYGLRSQLTSGRIMRTVHRIITLFVVIVTLYLGATGTLIQLVDLRSLLTHAPADDVNMEALREGGNGPGAFQVIADPDYTAAVLPGDMNLAASFSKVLGSARSIDSSAALGYVELRVLDGKPIGQVKADRQLLRFDALSGDLIPGQFAEVRSNQSPDSQRNTVKRLHRMTAIGDWTLWINVVVGTSLLVLIFTGLWMYLKLYAPRARAQRSGLFWSAGGWWRSLHRWISLTAAVFLMVVALSGTWLAVESLGFGIYQATHRPVRPLPSAAPAPRPVLPNGITALNDADVPAMLNTTLASFNATMPNVPIRVLRLRVYGGMPQGVIITGSEEAEQVVFNANTGRRASQTEPGYPVSGFPFGWQAHQIAKQVHRGDYFGISGRWMDLFAGLSMVFLSVSGAVMYFNMWTRRKSVGRSGLLWK